MLNQDSSVMKIINEVWFKVFCFTIMLMIVLFQKSPEKMKSLGQSDDSVKEQMRTGNYITTEFEAGPFADQCVKNLIFTGVIILIFVLLRLKNEKYEQGEEKQQIKQENRPQQEKKQVKPEAKINRKQKKN